MFLKKRISKIIPQWSLHPLRFPQFWGTETFFTIKEGVFLPLRLSCKESSTFLTKPLFPQEREDVTALRCSEPLRYKVGGPIKGLARLCGMGPPWLTNITDRKAQSKIGTFICFHQYTNDCLKFVG